MERRLTTILAADMVGYSRLMAADEEGVIARLRTLRADLIDPAIAANEGRIVKTMGDGLLVEFPDPAAAARMAISVQETMNRSDADQPEAERFRFRIGINSGEVIVDGDDVLGDAVNVAARLEGLSAVGGVCISRSVRDQITGKIDAPLVAMGPQSLKNIPEPVDVWRVEVAGAAPAPMAFDLPDRPSIIVLPFANMSADPDQEFFCDGMSEDITTALSRFSALFVIARNTAFTYKNRSVDVREVSRALGVQYVLEGSVRRAGQRLRITAQLIDAINDRHVWAEKWDRGLEDVFEVQDEMTERIVMAVAPEVRAAEIERARRKATPDLNVWELLARAGAEMDIFTADSLLKCAELLQRAIQIDGSNSESHAILANCHALEAIFGWNRPPPESLRLSAEAASRAIDLDRKNENALTSLGLCRLISKQHAEAISNARRALEINPNSSTAVGMLGMTLVWIADYEEAVELLNRALRQSPRDQWVCLEKAHLGFADFFRRRLESAFDHTEDAHRENPRNPVPLRLMTSIQGHLGRKTDAADTLALLKEVVPHVSIASSRAGVPYAREEDFEYYSEGLRRAGMPEE